MAAPTPAALLALLKQKEFLTAEQIDDLAERSQAGDSAALLRDFVRRQWLTAYQANLIAQGQAGELILGPYRILEPIGEGGMGKVYKARHVRMHRDVALKVIPPDCLENPAAVTRFNREVRAVAQLSHPSIVTAYEVGQEGKTHFFAMEFVEGIDLARLVKQSGPLPIAKACDYIRQAALGLQHAHEKGLVHRDIKPGNLIIGRSNAGGEPTVKVLDFGLARFEQAGGRATRLTKLGHVLGTVDYISPEQAGNAREADIRSDIYSLGCALYYLLTGQPPFPGSDAMERMMARVMRPAASVRAARPDLPPELDAIVMKMMAREPRERYATPAEVAAALAAFANLATSVTARVSCLPPLPQMFASKSVADSFVDKTIQGYAPRPLASWKRIGIIAAAVVIVLTVAGIGFMNRGGGGKTKLLKDDPNRDAPTILAQKGNLPAKIKPPTTVKQKTGNPSEQGESPAKPDLNKKIAEPDENVDAKKKLEPDKKNAPEKELDLVARYLSDLQAFDVKVAENRFANNGNLGYSAGNSSRIRVKGTEVSKGLSMCPESDTYARVKYKLPANARTFIAAGALNDSAGAPGEPPGVGRIPTPLTFQVWGDDKLLWKSEPVDIAGLLRVCKVDVRNIEILELRVDCPGSYVNAQAVWVDPRVFFFQSDSTKE